MESKLTLKSSDNELFEVNQSIAFESKYIKHMVEDIGTAEAAIPLTNVSGKILSKVIEYCKYHVEAKNPAEERSAPTHDEIETWDKEFVEVDQATLIGLVKAADYLNIKNLLDLTCETVACMMKGKTVEEIRKKFNIKNDYTPQEEEKVRGENQWAFE